MKQITHLLSLRIHQAYRILAEIGLILAIVALFAFAGVALRGLENMLDMKGIYAIPACLILIVIIDNYRKDKVFLQNIFKSRFLFARFLTIEYSIFLLPIILFQLIWQNYLFAGLIVFLIMTYSYAATFINRSTQSGFKKSIDFIPLSLFELKFFIEERKLSSIVIILLFYLGTVHISLWVLGMFLVLGIIPEIFVYKEPLQMIKLKSNFLSAKIKAYAFAIGLIIVPPTLLTWLISGMNFWIFLYGIVAILIALVLSIGVKYEHYFGLRDRIVSKTSSTIIILLMILPGFILVTLVYAIMKYIKADQQIKKLCLS